MRPKSLPGVLLAGLLLLTALPAGAQDAPPLPRTWGRYTLALSPRTQPTDDAPTQTLTVLDGRKVVQRVTAESVSAELQPLRPGGLPELVVSAYSGGAHCCTTTLIYTQDSLSSQNNGRPENIGVLDLGNFGVDFQDLNGDGTRELIVYSDNLAYYDWSYAATPALKTVLGWDGLRLADRTRFYPYVPAQEAARNLKEAQDMFAPDTFENLKADVAAYFGNMILAGRGSEAEAYVKAQLLPRSAALKNWWPAHRGDLIGFTYGQPEARLSIDVSPSWPKPDPQNAP